MTQHKPPLGWISVPLGEVADHALGKMLDKAKHTRGSALPYLRNINVQWFRIDTDDLLLMNFQEHELDRYGVHAGDLLVCEGGEPGRCAIWDGGIASMKYQKALHRVRVSDALDSRFLAYHLRDDVLCRRLENHFTGTTIKHFTGKALSKYRIQLPPVNEQRRIVGKIEALFERSRRARQALDAIPLLIEKLRQSILAAAFRGDLTADWRAQNPDVEPAERLLQRIRAERRLRWEQAYLDKLKARDQAPTDDRWKEKYKEPEPVDVSGLTDLPQGWCWASIDQLVDVQTGATPKRGHPEYYDGGTIPWVTSTVVNHDFVTKADQYITEQALRETNCRVFPSGTVLIAMYGEGKTRGQCTELKIECATNQAVAALRTDRIPEATKEFLKVCLELNYEQIRQAAGGGVQPNLNLTDIKNVRIPVPPEAEQLVLVLLVKRQLRCVSRLQESLQGFERHLEQCEKSILAKAFRGELMPQDPEDEPASVLLERIRAARQDTPSTKRGRRARSPESSDTAPATPRAETRPEPQAPARARPEPRAAAKAEPAPRAPVKARARPEPASEPEPAPSGLAEQDPETIQDTVYAALWGRGPLELDAAVRTVADALREQGLVQYQRLRVDGALYAEVKKAIDTAVRAGWLDRPRRGHVRAVEPNARDYTTDDWRVALLAALAGDGQPVDRDEAITRAAEWARDNMGLEFQRLRAGGVIESGIKSAMNSAIRRGELERIDATRIQRRT